MDSGKSRPHTFPTTQWTLVERAAAADPEERAQALQQICTLYWPPVYAYIRARGKAPHDAEDLTQDFFAELLQRNDFAKTDAGIGRLRSYLLTSVKNHLVSAHRRDSRLKRGGGADMLSIDAASAESRCLIPEPVDDLTSDRVYERQWAITLMEGVVAALEKKYAEKGRAALFHALKPFISASASASSQPGEGPAARQLGMSDTAFRVATHRLRQRYAGLLRQTVRATLGRGADEEAEIRHLMTVFQ